jgi:peptidyl-prolyl cis-trans isomerase C
MSKRIQWSFLARLSLICASFALTGAPDLARAQSKPASSPSPFAPGDLKRPIFDTQTPVYGKADQQAKSASVVVAEVDGRTVTLGDVKDAIMELPPSVGNLSFTDLFPGIQERLVREQALVIRAQRQALDEDPAVRRKIKAASDRILANELLDREVSHSITEAALLERYNKDVAGKPGPEEVHVRVIMVPTEQEAADIIRELRAGADFATLARRSSGDATAPAGGDVGFVVRDGLTPEIGAVVFTTQAGQFTPFPVPSVGSWFVLKVEERRRQATRGFGVERENLRQAMLREGVADVVRAALADVTVREYDFSGKETEASATDAGARVPQ